MKKIRLLILFLICIMSTNVYAASNKLYFSKKDGRLYYDSDLLDNTFMYHTDMIPGSSYTDELLIENGTDTEYNLYLKIKDSEDNNLLDQISMEVLLNGKVIYTGTARGKEDYEDDGMSGAIFIGRYKAKEKGELVVITSLSENYDNKNGDEAKVSWEFYGNYELIIPNTGDNVNIYLWIALLSIFGMIGISFLRKNVE